MKLSEYVTQVLNDPKYGRDPEWVRLNLSREHIERIEAARDAEVREQGEPSDASVRAALREWFQGIIAGGWTAEHEAKMRAALRAAQEAG